MEIPKIEIGKLPPDPVAPDALQGIPRQQTNPSRWKGEHWQAFTKQLAQAEVDIHQQRATLGVYATDASGIAYSRPHGVVIARSAEQIASLLKAAQTHHIPVTVRGGGLTTEGESVAYGGVLLDMTGMSRVININKQQLTVRTQAGIYWHSLAEDLRRQGLDYCSAPLNMTSSVGGTLGVGGIDINSSRLGCSADQALSLQVVTPTGDIIECSDGLNPQLFQRVILGYGQFGIITEVTLRIRAYNPIALQYFYYTSISKAIKDLQWLDKNSVCDYTGILTMMDRVITLLVAFDSDEREQEFNNQWRARLKGNSETGVAIYLGFYYLLRPWKLGEAWYLYQRKRKLFPDLQPQHHIQDGKITDRTVVFSRAVWKHWGGRQMVIPDISTQTEKFVDAVQKGNKVCKQYFPYYTLYCVGIKLRPEHKPHYEMSCIPADAEQWAYGCEFEPILENEVYSRDHLHSFKNEIYDIGVDIGASYYRFGGMMKAYIRRALGNELVDKHLQLKKQADPAMILNQDVVF